MKGKFHIGVHGTPAPCNAEYVCPFGSEKDHFSSKEEAQLHADEINERRNNSIDIKEGVPSFFIKEKKDFYQKLKRRTIENQSDLEVDRIRKSVEKELVYLNERLEDFKKQKPILISKIARYSCIEEKDMVYYVRMYDEFKEDYDEDIDPDYYYHIREHFQQKTYSDRVTKESDLEKPYTKLSLWQVLKGDFEKKVSYETIFSDKKDFSTIKEPDVIATQMVLRDPETNEPLERINLSREECKNLGVLAPGDSLIHELGKPYKSKTLSRNFTIGTPKERTNLTCFANEKVRKLNQELDNLRWLETRIENYNHLLDDIKKMQEDDESY